MAAKLILVADSSAWIATLRPDPTAMKVAMQIAMREHTILLPNLVAVEVLRGIDTEKQAKQIETEFNNFEYIEVAQQKISIKAAENFRVLRSKGFTVRSTIDLVIGTWCIENEIRLVHCDKDFDPMEKYLGLKTWNYEEPR